MYVLRPFNIENEVIVAIAIETLYRSGGVLFEDESDEGKASRLVSISVSGQIDSLYRSKSFAKVTQIFLAGILRQVSNADGGRII